MEIHFEQISRGYSLRVSGAWAIEPCELRFPEEVWESFPAKEELRNELAYVLTLAPPVILRHPTVWYSTPEPQFFDIYNDCFELSIPNMVEPIRRENSEEILQQFRAVGRHFTGSTRAQPIKRLHFWNPRRVVLPFSFGKDSLLSLATLHALGYEVILVTIDERVLPRGEAVRCGLRKQLAKDHGLELQTVRNEIQLLSDWQVLRRPETRLHQVHIYFVYLFAMIPFCIHFGAPTIVFNNEYHNSLPYLHREGYILPHKVMQSHALTERLARMAETFSDGQITVSNLIGGMGNYAIHRILHQQYPDFGKYRVTCHLEVSDFSRWCHDCYRCAQAFIYFMATGRDPFEMGFEESMLETDKKQHFSLFRESIYPEDGYHRFTADEERLAFLMADLAGFNGPLLDLFKERFPRQTEAETARLTGRVFRLHTKPGRRAVERESAALYKTFLRGYCSS